MTIEWLAHDDAIVLSRNEVRAFQIFGSAEHTDYVSLVRQAGLDPARFFESGNWEGIDLRDSDVTGVSFRSANLTDVCLYRDQYEMIRQTKPRTLDRARVQENREGGKGTAFTIEYDVARDQAKARADFQAVWEDQVSRKIKGEIEKIDWPLVTRYLRRLDQPIGRIWGLDQILDQSVTPSNLVYDACKQNFNLREVLHVLEWSTSIELLQVISLSNDSARIAFLEEMVNARTYLDERLTAKIIEKGADLTIIGRVMEIYQRKGWPLPPLVLPIAVAKLVKTMNGVREFLDLMAKAGIRPDIGLFAFLADSAKTFDDLKDFLDLMTKAAVRPDVQVFSRLAERVKTMGGVREFLDLMAKESVRPDLAVFSKLAECTTSMDGVSEFLDLMAKLGIKPDATVFAPLARSAQTMDEVRGFLDLMESSGVWPDTSVFGQLTQRAQTMGEVGDFLDLMIKAGVKPDATVFAPLARSAQTMDEVRGFLDLMTKAGARPDISVFAQLALRTRTMEEVRGFLDVMAKSGIRADTSVFSSLAQRIRTMDEVGYFLDLMTKAGIRPGTTVFNNLAKCARTMDEMRDFLDLMAKAGVRPSPAVFNSLAQSARTLDEVGKVRDLMAKAGIVPETHHWSVFLGVCRTVEDAGAILEALSVLGRKPNMVDVNRLMRNTENHIEAERVWSLINDLGLKPDFVTWGTLIKKMPNWAGSWEVYKTRRPAKTAITSNELDLLLWKSSSRQEVRTTLEEYARRRIGFDMNSVSVVTRAPLADHDLAWALRKMKGMGLDIQAVDSSGWTEGAQRFEEVRRRLLREELKR